MKFITQKGLSFLVMEPSFYYADHRSSIECMARLQVLRVSQTSDGTFTYDVRNSFQLVDPPFSLGTKFINWKSKNGVIFCPIPLSADVICEWTLSRSCRRLRPMQRSVVRLSKRQMGSWRVRERFLTFGTKFLFLSNLELHNWKVAHLV